MKVTNKSTVRVGAAGVAVIGIIVLFLVMFAVERIDSGQTGIIVNLAGSERGVDDAGKSSVSCPLKPSDSAPLC